jgi:hypothetical protein
MFQAGRGNPHSHHAGQPVRHTSIVAMKLKAVEQAVNVERGDVFPQPCGESV